MSFDRPSSDLAPPTAPRSLAALAGFAGAVAATALVGARFGPQRPRTRRWYRRLEKPPFNPPDVVFAPVWTALYATIATSGWRVWRAPRSRARTRALALWGTQLALNGAWTALFFGRHAPRAALADIVALEAAIVAYALQARRVDRPAAAMLLPYVAWVGFATALNAEIVRRNR